MRRIRWSVSGGKFAKGVWADIDDEVYEHAIKVWGRIKSALPGPGRTALVNELGTILDLAVCFPGSHFVEEEKPVYVPPYIERSRQRDQP